MILVCHSQIMALDKIFWYGSRKNSNNATSLIMHNRAFSPHVYCQKSKSPIKWCALYLKNKHNNMVWRLLGENMLPIFYSYVTSFSVQLFHPPNALKNAVVTKNVASMIAFTSFAHLNKKETRFCFDSLVSSWAIFGTEQFSYLQIMSI